MSDLQKLLSGRVGEVIRGYKNDKDIPAGKWVIQKGIFSHDGVWLLELHIQDAYTLETEFLTYIAL